MKTIVIYYSISGQTAFMAQKIANYLDCDLLQIQNNPVIKSDVISRYYYGGKSLLATEAPTLMPYTFCAGDYDTIILGCPTWGGFCPPAIKTFISQNPFSGKNMFLFTTYIAANSSRCLQSLANCVPENTAKAKAAFSLPMKKKTTQLSKEIEVFCGQLAKQVV